MRARSARPRNPVGFHSGRQDVEDGAHNAQCGARRQVRDIPDVLGGRTSAISPTLGVRLGKQASTD